MISTLFALIAIAISLYTTYDILTTSAFDNTNLTILMVNCVIYSALAAKIGESKVGTNSKEESTLH